MNDEISVETSPEVFVDIKAVAAHFAVSVSTVRTWIRNQVIPTNKVGGQYRFKLSAVEAALLHNQNA